MPGSFGEQMKKIEAAFPGGDVVVWPLRVDPEAIGPVNAIIEGYEYAMLLRSAVHGEQGTFALWVAPAYRDEAEGLLAELAGRYGVEVGEPHPYTPDDLAAGMHLRKNETNG
jgi:hypothetical protein